MTGFVDFPLPVNLSSSTTFAVLPPDFIQKKEGFHRTQPQACRKESKNAVLTILNAVDTFAPHPTVGTCTLSPCVPDPCHALLPPPPSFSQKMSTQRRNRQMKYNGGDLSQAKIFTGMACKAERVPIYHATYQPRQGIHRPVRTSDGDRRSIWTCLYELRQSKV